MKSSLTALMEKTLAKPTGNSDKKHRFCHNKLKIELHSHLWKSY